MIAGCSAQKETTYVEKYQGKMLIDMVLIEIAQSSTTSN
jgi:hypothetical protein